MFTWKFYGAPRSKIFSPLDVSKNGAKDIVIPRVTELYIFFVLKRIQRFHQSIDAVYFKEKEVKMDRTLTDQAIYMAFISLYELLCRGLLASVCYSTQITSQR